MLFYQEYTDTNLRHYFKLLIVSRLAAMAQAIGMSVSVLECRLTLKYWSNVVIAVSKTTWQFGQRSKWRLMAVSAEGASFPSKYQQIKWIVSLQVIAYFPQNQDFKLAWCM